MSRDLAGCTFTDASNQAFSFNIGAYCGPASLGADRRLVQIRLAGIAGAAGGFDEVIAMPIREFRRILLSMTIAGQWMELDDGDHG